MRRLDDRERAVQHSITPPSTARPKPLSWTPMNASAKALLPAAVIGSMAIALVALNTVLITVPLLLLTAVKLLLPWPRGCKACSRVLVALAERRIAHNSAVMDFFLTVDWHVTGLHGLQRDRSYLLVCNHQSWLDIPVLQRTFNRKIPFLRFFLKQQLIWVPLLGAAWWALDFPFLKRYDKAAREQNPRLRGVDMAATRKACARFGNAPVTVMNFLEGTRFTEPKKQRQDSPYRHLLRPRYGGVACVLGAMGEQLHSLIDVTIRYPAGTPSLWAFACGRIPRIEVTVVERPLPVGFSHFDDEPQARQGLRDWIDGIWQEKDDLLD